MKTKRPAELCRHLILATALGFGLGVGPGLAAQDAVEDNYSTELPTVELALARDLQQERLDAVEGYLNSVATMRARFVQQAPDGTLSRGIFHMERPGRVRFEYDGDVPILIVADGRTLNLVDYELGQVTKWPVDDSPLALLVAEQITLGKNVTMVSSGPGELANMISITASDPKRPEHGTMTLIFSASTPPVGEASDSDGLDLTLRGWQIKDSKGAFTTVRLSEPELNLPLESSLWAFDDPRSERFGRRKRKR